MIISGKNEQGKSSVLDSIELALKASNFNKPGRQIPRPIRDGEDKAIVILELDDYIITRNWTSNDKSYLKVENKEGATFKSPQALIDTFIGDLSFDPLQFARLKPADQKKTLLSFVHLDIDLHKLEEQEQTLYDERTLKGRELKTAQAQITVKETDPADSNIPDKEVSVSDLSAKLMSASQKNALRSTQQNNIDLEQNAIKIHKDRIAQLEGELHSTKSDLTDSDFKLAALEEGLLKLPYTNTGPIQSHIDEADNINTRIRDRKDNQTNIKRSAGLQFQYDTLSKKITQLHDSKAKALSDVQMPIKGLGIDDDGITFKDKPFSQIGSANQLKVSLAIAMAMNPQLRVIRITDGSLLDEDNKKIIRQMAKDNDYQIWQEEVEKDGKVGFTIQDGEVVAIDGISVPPVDSRFSSEKG